MSGSYQLPPAQEVQNLLRVGFLDTNSSVEMHIFKKKKKKAEKSFILFGYINMH